MKNPKGSTNNVLKKFQYAQDETNTTEKVEKTGQIKKSQYIFFEDKKHLVEKHNKGKACRKIDEKLQEKLCKKLGQKRRGEKEFLFIFIIIFYSIIVL